MHLRAAGRRLGLLRAFLAAGTAGKTGSTLDLLDPLAEQLHDRQSVGVLALVVQHLCELLDGQRSNPVRQASFRKVVVILQRQFTSVVHFASSTSLEVILDSHVRAPGGLSNATEAVGQDRPRLFLHTFRPGVAATVVRRPTVVVVAPQRGTFVK